MGEISVRMNQSDVTEALNKLASKSEAGEIIRYSAFTRRFFPRLPALVRNDVIKKVFSRKQRKNPTKENLIRSAEDAVRFGLKFAPFIEDKFPFVDSRNKAKSQPLTHAILMRDDAIQKLAKEYADKCSSFLTDEVSTEKFSSYLDALKHVYKLQRTELNRIYVQAPKVNFKNKQPSELEHNLQIAILKMQNEEWIEGRLVHLRAQYIEFAQIALDRVGENKHQQPYISTLSFSNWMQKQREARDYLESMAVMNEETGEAFNLEDVVKRTTANPENRRIENDGPLSWF